ncbi:MAG: LptF/LptG family permease [Bacteroidales bacterium]|nr:LptF/LptG family permease [Bacteroidales bacterium]
MKYKIIDRYILGKFLKTFCAAIGLIIVIVIVFDISEKLDDFLSRNAPLKLIVFQYYLNFIPSFVNLFSHLFVFISVIFFTSKLAGNTEIIAILGNGISFKRMLVPYLYGAGIIALVIFIFGNFIIPINNTYVKDFERKYIKNKYQNNFRNIHIQIEKGTQLYVESFDSKNNIGYKFTKEIFSDDNNMVQKITSDQITYDSVSEQWRCFNYTCRSINNLSEKFVRVGDTLIDIKAKPIDFNINYTSVETMNFFKLRDFIKQEQERGSHLVVNYKIEHYQRLLNPLAIIIMTVIGVAVSSRKMRGGVGIHLAIGISIAFSFIVFMKITTVFATNGNLSPFLAVLLPQIIYTIAAFVLIKKAPK